MGAGAAGLLLPGAASASAASWDGPPGLLWDFPDGNRTDIDADVRCAEGTRICANGPVHSGNLSNSQNVRLDGSANDSGSPTNIVGSPNSNNTTEGGGDNSRNNEQYLGSGRRR
ncbi:hypothetical protein LO771_05170 [Streptacidiphilus sp. ASG 303]|uniref:hypothetical protein n=1 Tax=Streptacidiphilus sp. ASG 303 TaxID=2896847 RepID=UPI001E5AE832|nr:hypothetical protein [Streptacidiphilus sp. ASG 303]MCD0481817.1 hypothetical protein [Streptacidiphilus sp. ASG 303]